MSCIILQYSSSVHWKVAVELAAVPTIKEGHTFSDAVIVSLVHDLSKYAPWAVPGKHPDENQLKAISLVVGCLNHHGIYKILSEPSTSASTQDYGPWCHLPRVPVSPYKM